MLYFITRTQWHYLPVICLILSACSSRHTSAKLPQEAIISTDTVFIDQARTRPVPVWIRAPRKAPGHTRLPVVILSHGYNMNEPGANRGYDYLVDFLAKNDCFVVSIQHELPTDSLMPTTGKPQVVRRSNWERGAANILFVINELRRTRTDLDFQHITLIGHSNGGDMSVLFAHQHPDMVEKVITLDHKRMLLPRASKPKVLSLRADDDPADEGVLPSPAEQQQFGITIIKLPGIKHGDFSVAGSESQHAEINRFVWQFLK